MLPWLGQGHVVRGEVRGAGLDPAGSSQQIVPSGRTDPVHVKVNFDDGQSRRRRLVTESNILVWYYRWSWFASFSNRHHSYTPEAECSYSRLSCRRQFDDWATELRWIGSIYMQIPCCHNRTWTFNLLGGGVRLVTNWNEEEVKKIRFWNLFVLMADWSALFCARQLKTLIPMTAEQNLLYYLTCFGTKRTFTRFHRRKNVSINQLVADSVGTNI